MADEEVKVEILDEDEKNVRFNKVHVKKTVIRSAKIEFLVFWLSLIAFILMGTLGGWWSWCWIAFFLGAVLTSLIDAVINKRVARFNYPFLVFLGMVTPQIWHPTWLVFLGIPVFYTIAGMIDRATHKF